MALLQVLPDLRGEDDEQDALLAGLAARFSPEDLQLLYQIAIMARRDLDFAPDARGGFEMALLRMLAFRPEAAGGPPGAAASSTAGRAPVSGGAGPSAPGRGAAAGTAASPPSAGGDWPAIVAALGLQGPAGQLAAHCVLVERDRGVVRLKLDRAGEMFRRGFAFFRPSRFLDTHGIDSIGAGQRFREVSIVRNGYCNAYLRIKFDDCAACQSNDMSRLALRDAAFEYDGVADDRISECSRRPQQGA